MIKNLKHKISQLGKEGLFHIFGSGVLAKVGGLISSVVVIRHLPKATYGSYVDAENLYSYIAIFVGLGISAALIQYCSERISEERKGAIFRYSLKMGSVGNLILLPMILGLAAIKYCSGDTTEAWYLALLSFLPFFAYADQYLQLVLRVKRQNMLFARTNMLYTVVHVLGNILMTLLWGVPGLIASQYLAHAAAAVHSAVVLRKDGFFRVLTTSGEGLDKSFRKEYLSYSLVSAVTNFASTVLVLLDVTCLGLLLDSSVVLADYKVAATIPLALMFVPKSLMTFYYPKLVSAFSEGEKQGLGEIGQVTKISLLANGGIFLCLLLFAPLIIWIVYGQQYTNIVPIFRVLSINYFAHALQNITGNTIAVLKKVKFNLVFSVCSGVLNIVLNLLLIPAWGSVGAAVATVTVTCVVLLLNVLYLWQYFRKN